MKVLINNIQGYSIHDGPGIRTVVFFKGCGLACEWCANPEGISPEVEIGFIENLCTYCGRCLEACPEKALSADLPHRIDRNRCKACGKCVDACFYKAMVRYGREMSVEEVFDAVRRDKMFYQSSGGGVTVSGGEPLLYASVVKSIFELCKGEDISTCIETSGFAAADSLLSVLPVTDYILFDLKHMNSAIHLQYTGQSNDLILQNAKLAVSNGADVLFRMPLIPSVNDTEENIRETADFIKSIQTSPKIQLMPYHRMGESKYKALDKPNLLSSLKVMGPDELEAVKQRYMDYGVDCSISR